jgi:hypothetical protein
MEPGKLRSTPPELHAVVAFDLRWLDLLLAAAVESRDGVPEYLAC